jgi:hypothetical protein
MVMLATTAQAADIAASKAPSDIWRGYARVKTYNKPDTFGMRVHPRDLMFDQPYQVASDWTNRSWTDTNRVYLGQLAGCNLECPYCYAGSGETMQVSALQYVHDYREYNRTFSGTPAGVLRISGGEPMLHQEWVAQVAEEISAGDYLWVDTNLTIPPSADLARILYPLNIGVCGCFKPGVEGVSIEDQLSTVWAWVTGGCDLYIYWPAWGGTDAQFVDALDTLQGIGDGLPLRLTVIHINGQYKATGDFSEQWSAEQAAEATSRRRDLWRKWCEANYPPEMLWLPSNQVQIR